MPILPLSSLTEIVARLSDVEVDGDVHPTPTIYASEPWNCRSTATVEWSPYKVGLPDIACENRLVRLIEVDVAQRFLNERKRTIKEPALPDLVADDLVRFVQDLIASHDPYAINYKSKKVSP